MHFPSAWEKISDPWILSRSRSVNLWKRKPVGSSGDFSFVVIVSRCLRACSWKAWPSATTKGFLTVNQQNGITSCRRLQKLTIYSPQMSLNDGLHCLLLFSLIVVHILLFLFYHSTQELTSRKWPQKTQKLHLARSTHPLTLWHSPSAMCEYNVGTLF